MPVELPRLGAPSVEGIPAFMDALERMRAMLSPRDWRVLVRSSHDLRSWKYFLALDPYTRWGLIKPRGYAGDARLMDFAYRHADVAADVGHAGPVGAAIYEYTSNAPQSVSARQRLDFVGGRIASLTSAAPLRIVSFASGFARELERLSSSQSASVGEFVAIDADEFALSVASQSAGAINCKAVRRNVVTDETSDIGQSGLVYSLGLFDYLTVDAAKGVLGKMLRLTAPGGQCVVANLSHEAANLGYCEGVMDWWMVTRSADDLLALGQATAQFEGMAAQVETLRLGCFHVLKIHREPQRAKPSGSTSCGAGGEPSHGLQATGFEREDQVSA